MTQPNLTPFEPATTTNPANDGQRYLESLYVEPRQAYTFHHDYPGGFNSWSAEARPVLRQLLGLDNMAQDTADHQPSVRLGEPETGTITHSNWDTSRLNPTSICRSGCCDHRDSRALSRWPFFHTATTVRDTTAMLVFTRTSRIGNNLWRWIATLLSRRFGTAFWPLLLPPEGCLWPPTTSRTPSIGTVTGIVAAI